MSESRDAFIELQKISINLERIANALEAHNEIQEANR